MSWAKLRREIYRRDGGICQVCGTRVGRIWDAGHLQDRIQGGADSLENVVVMHVRCNRTQKPITATRGEALAWMEAQQRPVPCDWRPVWELAAGKAPDGVGETRRQHK